MRDDAPRPFLAPSHSALSFSDLLMPGRLLHRRLLISASILFLFILVSLEVRPAVLCGVEIRAAILSALPSSSCALYLSPNLDSDLKSAQSGATIFR